MAGLTRLVIVLLFLSVPLAQAIDVSEEELVITVNLDLAQWHAIAPETDETRACDAPRAAGDAGSVDGQRPRQTVTIDPSGEQLIFAEDDKERVCAEVQYKLDIPSGAQDLHVTFNTQRTVSPPTGVAPHAQQRLRIHDQHDQLVLCQSGDDYVEASYDRFEGPIGPIQVQLTPDGCHRRVLEDELTLGFYFADGSEQADQETPLPTRPSAPGQSFVAKVQDVHLEFTGLPLTTLAVDEPGMHADGSLLGYSRVRVTLPDIPDGQEARASFSVSNRYGTHSFYEVTDQGLRPLDSNLIQLVEADGQLRFTIGAAVIAAADGNVFEVHFEPAGSAIVSPARLPIAGLALLAPIIFGVLAQRNLNHLQRTARGRLSSVRWTLQASLVTAWMVYLGVVFAMLVTPIGPGMAAWPLPSPNIVAYTALGTASFMMIVVSISGRRREMRIVVDDLTELERIQQELQRSNEELEQFAYVASHDLKEPLRMVAGFTQLLERHLDDRLDPDGRKYLGFASEGALRLQRMVDDLLAYSRVRHDRTVIKDVSLADVMVIVKGHLGKLLEERNVDLRVGDLPAIRADQTQMVQMLLNLVQNAIKFSPQDRPVVEVTAKKENGQVIISVRDEGVGIDPAQQQRIFQIFQRLHLREEYEGNGIGLAMVKKIAEQAGGHIEVTSQPGKGSTFTVKMPMTPEAPRPRRDVDVSGAPLKTPGADVAS